MDYGPSEDRSSIFECYKQRRILALNQNPGLLIGRFHWSDLEEINQSNAQIPHFSNIQDLSSKGLKSILTSIKLLP